VTNWDIHLWCVHIPVGMLYFNQKFLCTHTPGSIWLVISLDLFFTPSWLFISEFSSQGFHKEAQQTGWFKTWEMYCLSPGGSKSKIKVSAGPCSLWRGWERIFSTPSSLLLVASGVPGLEAIILFSHHLLLVSSQHLVMSTCKFQIFLFPFGNTGDWTQGLAIGRQVHYHLSMPPALFALVILG
jgi:hypothetical protein